MKYMETNCMTETLALALTLSKECRDTDSGLAPETFWAAPLKGGEDMGPRFASPETIGNFCLNEKATSFAAAWRDEDDPTNLLVCAYGLDDPEGFVLSVPLDENDDPMLWLSKPVHGSALTYPLAAALEAAGVSADDDE